VVTVCAKLGPHGLPCVMPDGHDRYHYDGKGRLWSSVAYAVAWAPPPVVPPVVAPVVTRLAAQVTERLATLDRVRPLLNAAIKDAPPDQLAAMTILAVEVSKAILRGGA